MYEVILYYKFTPIEDPEAFCEEHKEFCREIGIKGRIYISDEGINGTVGGRPEKVAAYKERLSALPGFEGIDFKTSSSDYVPFARLKCKTRDELVALHMDGVDPGDGGRYLEPREWRELMESDDDYVLIDVRNDYESKIGHFEGAITPEVDNFYDFPDWLEQAEEQIDKDKKVLMYCTGGIRCEKFSVLMKEKGWHDVNQLHGGIQRYAEEEGGKHYKGKCFVFDDRLVVPVNEDDMEPIARCEITGKPADTYINCANMECNKLFVCSEEGARRMEGCCSEECRQSEFKRPFDPENAFRPFRKWYHYFDEEFKEREVEEKTG
ncbi:rhodanese-related sulfurtransferase [Fodinibius sp.]|uniref:oxygen-dependent tRNA uridine(34) hydroxylase TrhO n=1 Tax=Fodinibius sp. TaxID=1872440 RepID=UPI00356A65DE